MNALRLIPVVLAYALLAAHFYRAGAWVPFGIVVALLPILFIRAPWAARAMQVALVLGALEWARTAAAIITIRQSAGQPWSRLAVILGTVALATALCALLFELRALKSRYGRGGE